MTSLDPVALENNPAPQPPQHSAPEPRSKFPLVRWSLVLAVLLAAFIGWNLRSEPTKQTVVEQVRTVRVVEGPVEHFIRISGQTAAREFATITAPLQRGPDAGAMILEFLVGSGKRVRQGEVVARFDTQALEDHIVDVEDQVRDAQFSILKRVSQHETEMEALAQSIRVLRANLDKTLLEARAAEVRTELDRELMRLASQEAEAAYKQNLADVASKKLSQASDLKLLEIAKIRTDRHLNRHTTDRDNYTIRSPRNGLAVVQQIYRNNESSMVQAGDQLRPGQPFLSIVNTDRMKVQATINQSEIELFRIGQRCRIRLDAVPNLSLPGEIHEIGAVAVGASRRENFFIRTVPITVLIEGSHELLIPDMSAAVEVILDTEPAAKKIPLSAVQTENGKTFVWVRDKGDFARRQVEIGLSSATHAAVRAGLAVGDEVALSKPATD